jgi:hypothetical protein
MTQERAVEAALGWHWEHTQTTPGFDTHCKAISKQQRCQAGHAHNAAQVQVQVQVLVCALAHPHSITHTHLLRRRCQQGQQGRVCRVRRCCQWAQSRLGLWGRWGRAGLWVLGAQHLQRAHIIARAKVVSRPTCLRMTGFAGSHNIPPHCVMRAAAGCRAVFDAATRTQSSGARKSSNDSSSSSTHLAVGVAGTGWGLVAAAGTAA